MMPALLLAPMALANESAERRAYEAAVRSSTSEVRLYDGWYTALLARATLVTPEVAAFQAERVAHLTANLGEALPPPEGIEVVLSAASHWKEALQVAGDGSAPWTVTLRAGQRACAGAPSVTVLKKPSELDRTLYPHITDWDRVFRLRWSSDACGGEAPSAMDIQGRHGVGEFTWSR